MGEALAWFALLTRPAVLLQLLAMGLLLAAYLLFRRRSARVRRLPWGCRCCRSLLWSAAR
jgi:hypothetical protein